MWLPSAVGRGGVACAFGVGRGVFPLAANCRGEWPPPVSPTGRRSPASASAGRGGAAIVEFPLSAWAGGGACGNGRQSTATACDDLRVYNATPVQDGEKESRSLLVFMHSSAECTSHTCLCAKCCNAVHMYALYICVVMYVLRSMPQCVAAGQPSVHMHSCLLALMCMSATVYIFAVRCTSAECVHVFVDLC